MKLSLLLAIPILTLPTLLYAQAGYSPLVDLGPAADGSRIQSFEQYINFLYGMSIAVAALLAVIKIIIAGAKYMLSDVISNKGEALDDIKGAILGLLLIISAVIILELINPQLTKRSIQFQELQSKRGDLQSLSVQTVAGGQTVSQFSQTLAQGLDSCVTVSQPQTSSNGTRSVTTANASTCGSSALTQLRSFERNCESNGGQATSGGTGSNTVICTTTIDGAAGASTLANSIANGQIINTTQTVGAAYVTQNGTTITTNVSGACDNNVKDLPASQQRGQFNVCVTNLLGRVESACEDKYGRFNGSNTSAVTCQLPRSTKSITELTDAFTAFKAADPSRRYHTIDALTLDEEKELCEKYARGTFYDNWGTSNTCIFY